MYLSGFKQKYKNSVALCVSSVFSAVNKHTITMSPMYLCG